MTHPSANLMPVEQALEYLLRTAVSVNDGEKVVLYDALDRILAEHVYSNVDVPPYDNSAVDGYVVGAGSVGVGQPQELSVSQRIPAGTVPLELQQGTAARIFTGAEVPQGGAAVVMQESCQVDGDRVTLPPDIPEGQNVRKAGQDVRSGQMVLESGRKLQPQDLGLLASVGIGEVSCRRRLKVAVLSTGDELIEPGEPAAPGKIFNSNRYTMVALLKRLGCDILDLGIVPDDYQATVEALSTAAGQADLILSSGGVSVGEEDHVKAAVEHLGQLDLWRLAIKPGKPLAFGNVAGKPFLGLPGNPSAVFVTFSIIARPFIEKLQGREVQSAAKVMLPVGFSVSKAGLRQEYMRVRVVERDGGLSLEPHPNQSSGVLSSATWAEGFAVIPPGRTFEQGDLVEYLAFSGLGI
ncbi:molybdopterin molybdenumtransferase MoeA [Hahella sp. CCB-MM4]|uniref:molybdopterin molybdotransferase MoeA n=1 Tax=Hahella sp. (strain CCB-MM4) TaxID=1926491 RepID=UPI000B9BFAF3|nr:gephyrin-like molybdotransferase Glp [Hahella sp. CCB-MM4]OZG72125.1 molybdopterin molybdenumtransferase MoeA [Hahella sp. CCB-MM4]